MKLKLTIKAKLIFANLIIFGLLLSAFAYFVYERTEKSELSQIDARLEVLSNKVVKQFEDELEDAKFPEWDELLAVTTEGLSNPGFLLQDSTAEIVILRGDIEKPDSVTYEKALIGQISKFNRYKNDIYVRTITVPVEIDEKIDFVLTVSTSLESVDSRLEYLSFILILSVLTTTVIAALIIYFVTKITFLPMSRMVITAESITANTLHNRVKINNNEDEVSRLGNALNNMMIRIENAFESQKRFVAEASHELRTPLTVIIGELEFMEKHLEQSKLKENVTTALGELDRLTRLVEQLLILTRIDAGRLTLNNSPVRLDEMLMECVEFLKKIAQQKNIKFNLQISEAVVLQADSDCLRSVILNLIDNAIKYADEATVITIELKLNQMQSVFLTISNIGVEISETDKVKIFDRFYRSASVRSNSNGSGLGLAIAKELVELHGGQIEVLPHEVHKVTFTIQIPLST